MEPERWSTVPNLARLTTFAYLNNLGVAGGVALGVDFKCQPPLFGEDGQGCQKAALLQQVFT